jgi:group I intron endonuclease
LQNNSHPNLHLQCAWNKYGSSSFEIKTLLFCDPENVLPFEQMLIDGLNPEYNIVSLAGSPLGYRHTESAKKKISNASKGHLVSIEVRQKMSAAQKGRPLTDEHKHKLNEARRGRTLSEEHKRHIGDASRGRVLGTPSDETRRKISESQKRRFARERGEL